MLPWPTVLWNCSRTRRSVPGDGPATSSRESDNAPTSPASLATDVSSSRRGLLADLSEPRQGSRTIPTTIRQAPYPAAIETQAPAGPKPLRTHRRGALDCRPSHSLRRSRIDRWIRSGPLRFLRAVGDDAGGWSPRTAQEPAPLTAVDQRRSERAPKPCTGCDVGHTSRLAAVPPIH